MKEKKTDGAEVKIPVGYFCGGNCSDCAYYELHNRRDDGRCWCNYYNTWYYPSERNGCGGHRKY